ncbi:MAG: MOSC domain-containing protein [Candidatus Dormibacteria bacterium]
MQLSELWRYPVKSLAGERLPAAELGLRGVPGDRGIATFEPQATRPDEPVSARDRPALLRFRARTGSTGVEVAAVGGDDWAGWECPEVAQRLGSACRVPLQLRAVPEGAFDAEPLLLLHLATVRALGEELEAPVDPRRFRATLYVDGPGLPPHGEAALLGARLRLGEAELEVVRVCPRCAVTTRDPDTWASWPRLLRHVVHNHDEVVGVYLRVARPGRVALGDELTVA